MNYIKLISISFFIFGMFQIKAQEKQSNLGFGLEMGLGREVWDSYISSELYPTYGLSSQVKLSNHFGVYISGLYSTKFTKQTRVVAYNINGDLANLSSVFRNRNIEFRNTLRYNILKSKFSPVIGLGYYVTFSFDRQSLNKYYYQNGGYKEETISTNTDIQGGIFSTIGVQYLVSEKWRFDFDYSLGIGLRTTYYLGLRGVYFF